MGPKKNGNQNIKVAVRCRPMTSQEKKSGSFAVVNISPEKKEVSVREKMGIVTQMKTFGFDYVFPPDAKQIDIYKAVVIPIIDEVLLGYNCTIFAYGQTGTGKTFTMEGERSEDVNCSWEDDPLAGVIPRSMNHIFDELKKQDVEFSIRVSFIELYNEELFDLLGNTSNLRMYEDPKRQGSLIIHGMEEITVNFKDEIYQILERGASRRQTASTLMNATSSRSHSVFSVTIHTKDTTITGEELLKTGKLYLVDLAGSENIGRSGAVDKRAREAGNINQSLLTLGRVITALVEHAPHVPYRESKLTRLLQDSLGGKTKTCIIATIAPSLCNVEETLSTLDYAHRAKNIQNRPEINQKLTKKALLKEYTNEIETLKKDLLAAREKNGIFLAEENYNSMVTKLAQQDTVVKEMEDRITALVEEKDKIQELFEKVDRQLEDTTETLNVTQNQLSDTMRNLTNKSNECDEQKFLVTEHMKTESELYSRAEKLLTTADDSTSDVYGLHAKLDRKKKVESCNSKQMTDFQQKFQASVEGMHQITDDMMGVVSKFHDNNTAQLNGLQEVLKTHSGSMLKSWFNVVENVKKHTDQMKSTKRNEFEETNSFLKETTTEVTKMQENSVDHLKAIDSELVSSLQSQMNAFQLIQTLRLQLKQQLEKQKSELEQFIQQLSKGLTAQLSSLSALVTDHVNWQQDQIQQMQQNIEESTSCNSNLEKYLTQAMDCIKLAQKERENSSGVNERISKLVTAQKENKRFENLQSEIKASQEYIGQQSDEVLGHTKLGIDSCIETVQKVENEVDDAQQKCTTTKTAFNEHFQKASQNWDDCLSVVSEKLSSYQTDANTSINVLINQTEKLDSITVSAMEEATALTEGSNESTSTHLKSLLECGKSQFENMSQDVEILKVKLTSQQNDVDSFTAEFAHDSPTGETPKRRQFSYPNDLPQTEDHDELITQFRRSRKDQYLVVEKSSVENTPVTVKSNKSCTPSQVFIDAENSDNASETSFSSTSSDISKILESKENRSQMPPPLSRIDL
ncbi:kinesin-like protein KIF11 [Octopus bimaculoides]|uniref:kinesin-like protein KIF11 n=1 Tax=Octopus bimaculoides TaxID=37653 RepID=UPI00071DA814|nr:kinesin-like protein KIF11 [Octopus bimaculoides]|eukprot:XP_014783299.1 PREDICTED: kinesin-like protein KIF11 [Octopus bimaculoides]